MADVDAGTAAIVEGTLTEAGLAWESPDPGSYVVQLPGTRKLSTTCSLRIGRHSLSVNAFVIRHPDENEAGVHRWLLERNLKLYGMAYAVDPLGDVYLTARLPLSVVTPQDLDRLLGTVLEAADGAFNTLLELGFAGRSSASTTGASPAANPPATWTPSNTSPTRPADGPRHVSPAGV